MVFGVRGFWGWLWLRVIFFLTTAGAGARAFSLIGGRRGGLPSLTVWCDAVCVNCEPWSVRGHTLCTGHWERAGDGNARPFALSR